MKKFIFLLLILFSSLGANVGKITAVKGEVYIDRASKQIKAESGSILELKDKVVTKDQAKALILMNDKTSITVGKNSTIIVSEYVFDENVASNNKAEFNFAQGVFRTITGKIGKLNKSKFKIKAKSASIGIRGTVFDVAVSKDFVKVGVLDGAITYENIKTGQQYEVPKGKKLLYDDTNGQTKLVEGPIKETKEVNEANKELKEEEKKQIAVKKDNEDKQEEKKEKESDTVKDDGEKKESEDTRKEDQVIEEKDEEKTEETVERTDETDETDSATEKKDEENVEGTVEQRDETDQAAESENKNVVDDTEGGEISNIDTTGGSEENIITGDEQLTSDVIVQENDTILPLENEQNDIAIATEDVVEEPEVIIDVGLESTVDTLDTPDTTDITNDIADVVDNTNDIVDEVIQGDVENTDYTEEVGDNPITIDDVPVVNLNAELQAVTDTIMNDAYSDMYMSFGYIAKYENDILTQTDTFFLSGDLTPSDQINQYILDNKTFTYSGGISSMVEGIPSSGTIDLNINFGAQSFTGNMFIDEGNWDASINTGSLNPYNFSSNDIIGTSDFGDITSGALSGTYYGPNADSVGGVFELNTDISKAIGVFGASQEE